MSMLANLPRQHIHIDIVRIFYRDAGRKRSEIYWNVVTSSCCNRNGKTERNGKNAVNVPSVDINGLLWSLEMILCEDLLVHFIPIQ